MTMEQKLLNFCGKWRRHAMVLVGLLTLSASGAWAQTGGYEVSGVVSSPNSDPIAGASVLLKGTSRGVATGSDGSYTISVPSSDAVLIYSFFGCTSEEVKVGGKTRIDVILRESAIALEEVVAIGYGTMKKSDLTGSVSSIKSDLLENKPIASFDNALRGQIAGVSVRQTDGQPGGGPRSVSAVQVRLTAPTSRCT